LNPAPPLLLAFHSGSQDLLDGYVRKLRAAVPHLPLCVVGEFQPPAGRWIQYFPNRTFAQNWARTRDALRGRRIAYSALILQPGQPYWKMRFIAALMKPLALLVFNETLSHFRVHPRSIGAMLGYARWRVRNLLHHQTHPGGWLYTALWRLYHPLAFRRPILYWIVRLSGSLARLKKRLLPARAVTLPGLDPPAGISIVIPTRNGRDLLARLAPSLERERARVASEVVLVDNGSTDSTAEWARERFPEWRIEHSAEPLSFAAAANRGIAAARFRYVCLLNNDMLLDEPGFFPALLRAFDHVPDLFCATAQILFPFGRRREETGKAVKPQTPRPEDFPIRCDLPVDGEDLSYVLYGSGGCSLYDARRLRALGGFCEAYTPAYVEDLDLGYRAWQQGWPTVFTAAARVWHFHRSTTARYYDEETLTRAVQLNYLKFLARAVAAGPLFARLWKQAVWRLNLIAGREPAPKWALASLAAAAAAWRWAQPRPARVENEAEFLALASGDVAVFPGRAAAARPLIIIASPYLPFPLSHGGAVRMYNLMRRAAATHDLVLLSFCDQLACPPREVLDLCCETVLVRRADTHLRPLTRRPDVVEEFDQPAFRAALKAALRKWAPALVQLEFTQMGLYAPDCGATPTLLVEHDVTLDLYAQLLRANPSWELRQQHRRWESFERDAWRRVSCVAVMSEKDRAMVSAPRCEVLANGVDLERYTPSAGPPDPRRLLFLGSFQHLPNLLALDWFLREVWPRLTGLEPALHVIAGARHQHFLDLYRERVQLDLRQPGIELEGFVSDVRPAYRRAEVVIAPLLASAGTNIKILEAMAMGKPIASTPAGINGIELRDGSDVLVCPGAAEMAAAIRRLFLAPALRETLALNARRTVEERFSWDAIACGQLELYRSLARSSTPAPIVR
jgi:GT2 family glycosyltransferase/glycosyltransferase involved in cell wall biosynthesis